MRHEREVLPRGFRESFPLFLKRVVLKETVTSCLYPVLHTVAAILQRDSHSPKGGTFHGRAREQQWKSSGFKWKSHNADMGQGESGRTSIGAEILRLEEGCREVKRQGNGSAVKGGKDGCT